VVVVPPASASAVPEDVLALYQRACDGGSGVGCNNLALARLEGRSGARHDGPLAAKLFQRACDLGVAAGCGNLGFLLHEGKAVPPDDVRAIGLLTRACDASWWEGCYWLGDIYFAGEHEDQPQAYALFERACKEGHAKSCASQGLMLQGGHSVPKDGKLALTLLERGCEGGVAFGCTVAGYLLLGNDGVAPDLDHGRKYYERGCTDTYPTGCYAFGMKCMSGAFGEACDGVAPLRRACGLGHADACAALAVLRERRASDP
jgi:TPR repeat protein